MSYGVTSPFPFSKSMYLLRLCHKALSPILALYRNHAPCVLKYSLVAKFHALSPYNLFVSHFFSFPQEEPFGSSHFSIYV